MSGIQVVFQALNLRQATEDEYAGLSEFKNALNREYRPDDPPIPLEEHIQGWKTMPDFVEYEAYTAWDPSNTKMIAYCDIDIYNTGDNEHLADFMIELLPEYRHQGIGRHAMNLLLRFAREHKRTSLISFTTDRISEGELFLERLGARKGLETQLNQLKLSEFDKDLVNRWLGQSGKLNDGYELRLWEGAYPDTYIDEVSALYQEVANDEPRDNLDMEDMNFTPQVIRDIEKNMFARGNQRWTMYLTDRADKKLAGLTEVFWNPNRGMILNQGFTGVYPAHRSKGLGRWLKAEMMKKILRERPEVQVIRTGNANSNAPMLKINNEMGFKPYIANTVWQVDTAQVEKYLNDG